VVLLHPLASTIIFPYPIIRHSKPRLHHAGGHGRDADENKLKYFSGRKNRFALYPQWFAQTNRALLRVALGDERQQFPPEERSLASAALEQFASFNFAP
jgi:hypothetical protein